MGGGRRGGVADGGRARARLRLADGRGAPRLRLPTWRRERRPPPPSPARPGPRLARLPAAALPPGAARAGRPFLPGPRRVVVPLVFAEGPGSAGRGRLDVWRVSCPPALGPSGHPGGRKPGAPAAAAGRG